MTWHLKDRELEKKLIELCPRFLSALDLAVYLSDDNENCVLVEATRQKNDIELADNVFYFCMDELEEVHEYNPKAWNKFPQVIPPENVRMRVEFNFEDEPEKTYHACFHFFSGKWYLDTCKSSIASSIVNIRYRPWED